MGSLADTLEAFPILVAFCPITLHDKGVDHWDFYAQGSVRMRCQDIMVHFRNSNSCLFG